MHNPPYHGISRRRTLQQRISCSSSWTESCSFARFSRIGTLRPDIRPGLRMPVEGNYLLLYEHDAASDTV